MPNYCIRCGRQFLYEAEICDECSSQPTVRQVPFADPVEVKQEFDPFQTRPLNQPGPTSPIQPFQSPGIPQVYSQCPYCGGSGGVSTKSTISTGGFVYMGIMFTITFLTFAIFFPCAIIPFGLIFLGLLFKETHFTCINCGQKVN